MSKRTKELLRANNALDAQLNKANQQVMTNIVVYIRSANISEYEQELVRRDIAHMLLDAQAEGRTAEEVLGEDAQVFCEAVIAVLPPRSQKERLLDSVRNVLLAFVVLGVIWLAYGVIDMVGAQDWPYLPLTLGDVIGQVLILAAAFYIFHSISRHAFDDKLGRLFVLVFVVLGGIGNIRGSVIAAVVLTLLPELLRFLSDYRMLIYAVVLIVTMILVWSPGGIAFRERLENMNPFRKKEKEVQ